MLEGRAAGKITRTYETQRMHGLFGALRAAGPDFWGRRVIEKHAGALGFGLNAEPPAPQRKFNQTIELARLQSRADQLIRDEDEPAATTQHHEQVSDLRFELPQAPSNSPGPFPATS